MAQKGAKKEKASPESEKMVATSVSAMPNVRPIDGITDAIPVRPIVVIIDALKMMLKDRRGSATGADVVSDMGISALGGRTARNTPLPDSDLA